MGSGDQRVVQEQRMSLPTQTIRSTIIISYPKITEGPSLVRRKLGSIKWDMVHNGIQGQKRDLASCPVDYNLCPKSMSGGCCPKDRVCGTSSCFPISAAPASACGKSGYTACGIPEGGAYHVHGSCASTNIDRRMLSRRISVCYEWVHRSSRSCSDYSNVWYGFISLPGIPWSWVLFIRSRLCN